MLPHPHPTATPPAPFPRLARPTNPLAAAVRAEALARLPDVLPPAVYAGVAAYLDGADHLPAAVAAEVRGRLTAAEFAELLGVVARVGAAADPTAGPPAHPDDDAVPPPEASPGVRRVTITPEKIRADCLGWAAQDPQGRSPEFWAGMMYPPGVGSYTGPTGDGRGLSKDMADGIRPTLVRPGAAVADLNDGPGIVVAVTADRCVVRYPATGEVRELAWFEVWVDHAAPDPAFLPAARPATRRPRRGAKGGARCTA